MRYQEWKFCFWNEIKDLGVSAHLNHCVYTEKIQKSPEGHVHEWIHVHILH